MYVCVYVCVCVSGSSIIFILCSWCFLNFTILYASIIGCAFHIYIRFPKKQQLFPCLSLVRRAKRNFTEVSSMALFKPLSVQMEPWRLLNCGDKWLWVKMIEPKHGWFNTEENQLLGSIGTKIDPYPMIKLHDSWLAKKRPKSGGSLCLQFWPASGVLVADCNSYLL